MKRIQITHLPGASRRGFDPTNNSFAGPEHVSIAVACEAEKASPVCGAWEGLADAFDRNGSDREGRAGVSFAQGIWRECLWQFAIKDSACPVCGERADSGDLLS